MAFGGGFVGGFADTDVVVPPPPPPPLVVGGPVWTPATRPAALRRQGRATLRLKVSVVTWGAEGTHRTRHIVAPALIAEGTATSRSRSVVVAGSSTRHGQASMPARARILTHVGDPREDDQIILIAVSALLSGRT